MSRYTRLLDKYDVEIIEEKYNKLIERYEVILKVLHTGEGTPSRGLLKVGIAKLYNKEPDLVYIRKAETSHGNPETLIEAHIYNSRDRARLFEPEYTIKRDEESMRKVSTQ